MHKSITDSDLEREEVQEVLNDLPHEPPSIDEYHARHRTNRPKAKKEFNNGFPPVDVVDVDEHEKEPVNLETP